MARADSDSGQPKMRSFAPFLLTGESQETVKSSTQECTCLYVCIMCTYTLTSTSIHPPIQSATWPQTPGQRANFRGVENEFRIKLKLLRSPRSLSGFHAVVAAVISYRQLSSQLPACLARTFSITANRTSVPTYSIASKC